MALQIDWLAKVNDSIPRYLATLRVQGQPGRFFPCVDGSTELGRRVALGFSCFALKTYFSLGLWEKLDSDEKKSWISLINSYQTDDDLRRDRIVGNAFIDTPLADFLAAQVPWHLRLLERFFHSHLTFLQKVIISETKQAIATLAQVGEFPRHPYRGFPTTQEEVKQYLERLDWNQPWSAGAQASTFAVFLTSQAPELLPSTQAQLLSDTCMRFIDSVSDRTTGTYFKGPLPDYGEAVNGAMKVLTALDWLGAPIHYPERLVDTCLERLPLPDGCHLVDAIYVLYRCLQESEHRRADAQKYCLEVLEMIHKHYNLDGGFSFYVGRSQTNYYRAPISRGLAESDIHGTTLLVWAAAMILEILEENSTGWQVMRP